MLRNLLFSKIHRASVTDANLEYEGSLTIDAHLIELAQMKLHEKVLVVNLTNGARFETYIIEGARHSGVICANGAAARLVQPKDQVIIMAFALMGEEEADNHKPLVIKVNSQNEPLSIP